MGLNIKNERTVALVRDLATRTGMSQTAAIEDAVIHRLAELERSGEDSALRKRTAAAEARDALNRLLTDEDRHGIHLAEQGLFDDSGLPQ